MVKLSMLVLSAAFIATLWPADTGNAGRGRELFQKRCEGCHAVDTSKVGPALRGVFGRRSAADAQFPYSDALKSARVTWDASTLDRWLTDPDSLAPGNDMAFRMENAGERSAIIEFLRQLPAKPRH
jgi:cytochrome c